MQNSSKNKRLPKINAYVYRKKIHVCPVCVCNIEHKTSELGVCPKCKRVYVTYSLYTSYRNRIVCMNPEDVYHIQEENRLKKAQGIAKKKAEEERISTAKQEIVDLIVPELETISYYPIRLFRNDWAKTNFPLSVLESLIAAFVVKDQEGKYKLYFVSINKKARSKISKRTFDIVGTEDWLGKRLIASQIADYDSYYIIDKEYKIAKRIILNDSKYEKRIEKLSSDGLDTLRGNKRIYHSRPVDVYVYFRLANTCVKDKHSIETVTAKTINVKNNQPVEVNVFYCRRCNKYFINYEALQGYFARGIYPALQYTFNTIDTATLKEASELMLYGYNVRDGNLTMLERRILEWIIDSGLLSKVEIIKDLQFKARYNGSKSGNERAKQKWLDDIQFVNGYVRNNKRAINARFILKK